MSNERSFEFLTPIDWLVYWIAENSKDNYWYVSRVSILYQNNDVYSDVTCPWSPKHIISQSFIIHIRLWQAVTTITNDISTSAVTRSITCEEKECTLQLMCLSFSTHWNLILPSSFSLGCTKFGNLSRNITRWNGVWACESYPFYCERFACMILVYRISQDKQLHKHRWITPAFAALYAACNCGILTICPLILAVATKLP